MDIKIAREVEYIPVWNDNENDPEPIKFKLKMLTTEERDSCSNIAYNTAAEPIIKLDGKRAFRRGVVRIDNLKVNGEAILNAEKMLKSPGLYDLYIEISGQILTMNQEEDSKN